MPTSKLKTILYTLWPKLLVISAGLVLYLISSYYLSGDFKSLMLGVAGSLISIPIIFISYEVWQKKSQKQLNLSVYEYAERKVQASVVEILEKLDVLVEGAFVYFEQGSVLIDDSDVENIIIKSHQYPDGYWDDEEGLLSFEQVNVFENITDARYLEFQLNDLSLTEELEQLESLLANAFIMQRIEDKQVRVLILLIETISMLEALLNNHEEVFCKSSINIHGFSIEKSTDAPMLGMAVLMFKEAGQEQPEMLDIKPLSFIKSEESPLQAYVVNPDCYAILSDLIFGVIDAINQWKSVSDPVFIDYENAQIRVI